MHQAGKIRLNSRSASPRGARRDSSEAALAADYRFSPVAQVALDRDGCIRRINIAAAVLLKADLFQLTDIPFIAFVNKAYCRLFLDHLAQATSGPKKICTRLVLSSATRAIGPVELQSTSNVDRLSGSLFCRTAIVMLSPTRSAVPSSSENDQYPYQGWLELFPDAAILEIGGKIISANPSAWRLLGTRSLDELQGQDLFATIHPDCHPSVRDRVMRLPKGKSESTGAEEKFVRIDGKEIVVNIVLKSVNLEGVFATLIVARDLSKEREVEEKLVRAKDLCTQILANNSIATAIISLGTGRFIETNEIFCRLTARPQEQILGQSLSAIRLVRPVDHRTELLTLISEIDSSECEARLIRPDGSVLDVLVSAKEILSGHERCLLLMIQDLTDLRRLRKDVIAISEEEQRRFSRDLHDSHCQDLTAIAFFAETIAAGFDSSDKEAAKQIRMVVDMVQKSADNVHALAAGLDSQHIQESGLGAALENLASRTSRRFGLVCTAELGDFKEFIFTQAIHLYRIAQEAVSNAARHSRAHTVRVRFECNGETGFLQIHDDGIGFSADHKSTGLGLRTMQYRASIIGGTLEIDSKLGAGTIVTCSFPISVE